MVSVNKNLVFGTNMIYCAQITFKLHTYDPTIKLWEQKTHEKNKTLHNHINYANSNNYIGHAWLYQIK